jgi:FlaA1/EpsC-like NDP-sugar epimerase
MSTGRAKALPQFLVRHRALLSAAVNVVIIAFAYTAAFLLRFDLDLPHRYVRQLLTTLPAAIVLQYLALSAFKLTRGWWRYVGIVDFLNSIKAALAGSAGLAAYVMIVSRAHYPRSILLLFAILVVGLTIGVRLAVRLWREHPGEVVNSERKRILIIGAGDTGEALLREVRQSGRLNYHVVAFLDDDPRKRGAYINGVPVVDVVAGTAAAVQRFEIESVVVATPSASGAEMRKITEHCRDAGVPFKVLPATWEVLHGRASFGAARDVEINDLLRRPPVALDLAGIERLLKGKRILVSGAGGSIGSEICRQVLRFEPAALHCVEHDENALFYLERSLRSLGHNSVTRYHLADITDPLRMEALFAAARPQIVFHAAAHKHVPIVEANVLEGVRNNVFGTETLADNASRHEAETFVLISTDKAVNPTSIMGATKRIAEQLIQTMAGTTRFTSVRFGNVLGSQGSVVPILKEQIAKGGPVTITHPEMRRYFMTIPEAVELVIQSGSLAAKGETFILDMGEQVRIVDLARDLITLSGLRPDVDVQITFTGIRPGEKLYEDLHLDAESTDSTTHPKILVSKQNLFDRRTFARHLDELRVAVRENDEATALRVIRTLVPEYRPDEGARVIPVNRAAAQARSTA